jgi:hypothetical protein
VLWTIPSAPSRQARKTVGPSSATCSLKRNGGAVAIAGMEAFSARAAFPLVTIPFATSIVTVLGSPEAEPATATGANRWPPRRRIESHEALLLARAVDRFAAEPNGGLIVIPALPPPEGRKTEAPPSTKDIC